MKDIRTWLKHKDGRRVEVLIAEKKEGYEVVTFTYGPSLNITGKMELPRETSLEAVATYYEQIGRQASRGFKVISQSHKIWD